MKKLLVYWFGYCVLVWMLSGCATQLRAKGGTATHITATGAKAAIQQPDNPKDAAKQAMEISDTAEYMLPAGAVVSIGAGTNVAEYTLPTNTVIKTTHNEKSHAEVGAAQHDTVGEVAAKLKSIRWLVVVGVLVFVGGLACAFVPYLSTILGGMTPGLSISAGGLAVAILPYVIIGNEKLLMVGAGLATVIALALVWVHNHGGIAAELNTLKTWMSKTPPGETPGQ